MTINNANYTCEVKSTVDYILNTPDLLNDLNGFQVLELKSLISDPHCPISAILKINEHLDGVTKSFYKQNNANAKIKQWDSPHCVKFAENINFESISTVESKTFVTSRQTNVEQIDDIVQKYYRKF